MKFNRCGPTTAYNLHVKNQIEHNECFNGIHYKSMLDLFIKLDVTFNSVNTSTRIKTLKPYINLNKIVSFFYNVLIES